MVTITISGFLYREFNTTVYKYLLMVMLGALFSLIVEAVRIYSRIVPIERGLVKTIIYAFVVILTFPLEIIMNYARIHPIRDFFGFIVFYSFSYIILAVLNKETQNYSLKKAIKGYLILAAITIPFTFFFETGIYRKFITIEHPEIPFPYILYCLSFNFLCLINAYKYIFKPVSEDIEDLPNNFLIEHSITEREIITIRSVINYVYLPAQ